MTQSIPMVLSPSISAAADCGFRIHEPGPLGEFGRGIDGALPLRTFMPGEP